MKYIAYTDGSGNTATNRIGCSYIIFTADTYIDSGYKSISGMTNPTRAETIAVGLTAGIMLEKLNLTEYDTVEFNVDCLSVIQFCKKYIQEDRECKVSSSDKLIVMSIQLLRKLSEVCTVNLYKVHGHRTVVNPNSYVDRLAKLGARK